MICEVESSSKEDVGSAVKAAKVGVVCSLFNLLASIDSKN